MRLPFSIPKIEHRRVVKAIRDAELRTSGEIRVIVARHKASDPIAAATAYFKRFRMDRSPHRNGVLFFLAPRSRRFAVIGDAGVHEKCGDGFWGELARAMEPHFAKGDFTDGLVLGVERAGGLLGSTFPRGPGDAPAPAPSATEVD